MSIRDDKIIAEAKERLRKCEEWENQARVNWESDYRFGYGDSVNGYQWDEDIKTARTSGSKPCLTVNRVRQYCLQIVNDARQNKSSIEVRPVGEGSSYKSAEVMEGVIRHIEYVSNADSAYDKAVHDMVFGGIGYWRIVTDYIDADSFDQEIYIRRIPDALSVFLDPNITEYDGSDARFGIIYTEMDKEQFKKDYPRHADCANDMPFDGSNFNHKYMSWLTNDRIIVAEYYRVIEEDDTLFLMPGNQTIRQSEIDKTQMTDEIAAWMKDPKTRKRDIKDRKIEWFKIAGQTIIERTIWLGKYIPIIRCVGEETVIDGIMDRIGHVRALIDAQRCYNYYTSASIEFTALQTKTPWLAPIAAVENSIEDFRNSNLQNLAVLTWNHIDDEGNEIPAPTRPQAPQASEAYLKGMESSINEMEMASGQFAATLGQPSNERSGKAIQERQRNALNSTYHYVDHFSRAIRHCGKQLIDLIPKVYDVPRVLNILAIDGTQSNVMIDNSAPQAHAPANQNPEGLTPQSVTTIFNPTVGTYDIISDVGPDFATRRQDAYNAMSNILSQDPELGKLIGDLMFRAADFPMADEIAERLKNMVPPQALGIGPSPQEMALQQQLQTLQQTFMKQHDELIAARSKNLNSEADKEIDFMNAETKRLEVVSKASPVVGDILMKHQLQQLLQSPDILNLIAAHLEQDNKIAKQAGLAPIEQQGNQTNG